MDANGWTLVEDEPPEDAEFEVIAWWNGEGPKRIGIEKPKTIRDFPRYWTHWMPLPSSPTIYQFKSVHGLCPYGNDECPTCNPK